MRPFSVRPRRRPAERRGARSLVCAVLVCGAAGLSACSSDDAAPDTTAAVETEAATVDSTVPDTAGADTVEVADTTTAADTAAAPSTEVSAGGLVLAPPTTVGEGLVEQWSRDGRAVLLYALDDALSEEGCEGVPAPVLFVQPLDGAARTPALASKPAELSASFVGRVGTDTVVGVEGCEGITNAVVLATEGPDGHLSAVRRLEPTGGDIAELGTAPRLTLDGRFLLLAGPGATPGTSRVVRMELETGALTELPVGDGNVTKVAELADGRLLVSDGATVRTVEPGGGVVGDPVSAQDFDVSPDGRTVAYVDGDRVWLVAGGRSAEPSYLPVSATTTGISFSPDGTAVAVIGYAERGDDGFVAVVRDAKVHLVVQGGTFGRLVWAPGSDAVAYNDFGSLSADVERAMVARKLS